MNKKIIEEAIEFFDIKDLDYKDELLSALDIVSNDNILKNKVQYFKDILFFNEDDKRYEKIVFDEDYKKLFNNYPYLTNIVILSEYKLFKKNIKKIDKEIIQKLKLRIKEVLLKKTMSYREMIWLSHFILGKIIEVGCLQFQITNVYYFDAFIKVHIPRGVNFDIDNIKKSIEKSKYYIKKYYNAYNPKYYCVSWMLGKQVRDCLNKDSNIYKFSNLFDIKENIESNDILRFVFNNNSKNEDYSLLEEKTSLQKKVKEKLLKNEKLYNGIGILKDDYL